MDFFAAQDIHRRNTIILLFYFTIATALTASAAYLTALAYLYVMNHIANFWRDIYGLETVPFTWWSVSNYYLIAGPCAAALVSLSLWRTRQLSAPIDIIMPLIGANEVERTIMHPPTKQFIDVVEEMAIASGTPMPRTFVMPREFGINAMAVGWSADKAAIAVSGGAIQMLSRNEMQGVVAHEFSHILNGDMAMNVRLLGVLYGIDCIGVTGRIFLSFLVKSGQMGIPGHSNVVAMCSWVAILLSLPLAALSWLGVLFGQLIRAAISRQREYLADASAVQFTRFPDGIAGALTKIGGLTLGSSIRGTSLVTSHFFLASAFGNSPGFLSLASHPPLVNRVKRIKPDFDGSFPYLPMHYEAKMGDPKKAAWQPGSSEPTGAPAPVITAESGTGLTGDDIAASLTAPDPRYADFVRSLLSNLPGVLVKTASTPEDAVLVIYAILLSSDERRRAAEMAAIKQKEGPGRAERTLAMAAAYAGADPAIEVPLLDRAFKSISKLSSPELLQAYESFRYIFPSEKAVDTNDFVFLSAVEARMSSVTRQRSRSGIAIKQMAGIEAELLTIAVYLLKWKKHTVPSKDSKTGAQEALPMLAGIDIERIDTSPDSLKNAFSVISRADPDLKKEVLVMMVKLLAPDGVIGAAEAEMIWLIAELARARIPPLMPGTLAKRSRR
jgi:Zn-dependent protease with chaperone function/uncharacterized tellurite resistance protein B-like protein